MMWAMAAVTAAVRCDRIGCSRWKAEDRMKKLVHGGDIYRNKNVIDFSSNCNPFGPPEGVKQAIRDAAEKIGEYPDVMCTELRETLAEKLCVPGEMIFFGNGAAEVIFSIAFALKPEKALLPAPTFAEYEQALAAVGCEIEHYMTYEKDSFGIREDMMSFLTEDIDVIFICNPNNPTGTVTDKDMLMKIADRCMENDITLVIDECFLDFAYEGQSMSMMNELANNGKLVILKAFTKLYAMAGVRLGYCVSSDTDLLERMNDAVQPWNVSTIAQLAGAAALKEDEYAERTCMEIKKERLWLADALKDEGLKVLDSEGNYLFFTGSDDLYDKLMEKGIMIRDCSNYRGLYRGCYRAAVKLHEDNVKLIEALRSI